jgi:hypothetical protein
VSARRARWGRRHALGAVALATLLGGLADAAAPPASAPLDARMLDELTKDVQRFS